MPIKFTRQQTDALADALRPHRDYVVRLLNCIIAVGAFSGDRLLQLVRNTEDALNCDGGVRAVVGPVTVPAHSRGQSAHINSR
jgi:hypothetical protein